MLNKHNSLYNKKFSALVPMKAHSERVPNKNIRDFSGHPLFFHIINTLDKCSFINKILINTDSKEIAKDAVNIGNKVEIISRPQELCGDFVSMNDIIEHDLDYIGEEFFIQTHSTNPLLQEQTLNTACKQFLREYPECDSLFSVTSHQTRFYWKNLEPINHNPEELKRTQDLPTLYSENSCFYIFSKTSFIKNGKKRIGKKPSMFLLNQVESTDIDTEDDFQLAEKLYKALKL